MLFYCSYVDEFLCIKFFFLLVAACSPFSCILKQEDTERSTLENPKLSLHVGPPSIYLGCLLMGPMVVISLQANPSQ